MRLTTPKVPPPININRSRQALTTRSTSPPSKTTAKAAPSRRRPTSPRSSTPPRRRRTRHPQRRTFLTPRVREAFPARHRHFMLRTASPRATSAGATLQTTTIWMATPSLTRPCATLSRAPLCPSSAARWRAWPPRSSPTNNGMEKRCQRTRWPSPTSVSSPATRRPSPCWYAKAGTAYVRPTSDRRTSVRSASTSPRTCSRRG
mmetsp:Transcript_27932/g.86599  ORF Transcript_27932/g.86599 Transcript_27932/m.86599 type:complete len:204 (-) Transcript_27932:1254-1865(-)